jgi:thiol-disulfide isomerase/thioredoxin
MSATPVTITFYTRPGCHLCDDVADQLDDLADSYALAVTAIDITSDLDLHRRYWNTIPVVIVGTHTLHAPIDPARLAAIVAAYAPPHARNEER